MFGFTVHGARETGSQRGTVACRAGSHRRTWPDVRFWSDGKVANGLDADLLWVSEWETRLGTRLRLRNEGSSSGWLES